MHTPISNKAKLNILAQSIEYQFKIFELQTVNFYVLLYKEPMFELHGA